MLDKKMLFIFDLANNHSGDVNKGLQIIREIGDVCKQFPQFDYCVKFQYRNFDTFIHKDYTERFDIKYIKRFQETKLTQDEFMILKKEIESYGFLTGVTCFDNDSVDIVEQQNFDIFKIASVSMQDFPLLERIAKVDKPIIISTAAASLEDIDNVVTFFKNRKKDISILHCRAEYPIADENLELNQIDLFKKYNIPLGFSSHQDPGTWNIKDSVKLAIAKGCSIYEIHIDTDLKTRNKYSRNADEVKEMLEAATEAFEMCGVKNQRYAKSEKEEKDLMQFRRGMFAKKDLMMRQKITKDDVYFAIPYLENQVAANDFRKYLDYTTTKEIIKDDPIFLNDVEVFDRQPLIWKIYSDVKDFIIKSGVAIPEKFEMDLSHHFGLSEFYNFGTAIITLFNREYAKKLLIVLPGQCHPCHAHIKKEETFNILYGDLNIIMNFNEKIYLKEGDFYTVEREKFHSFGSINGCILEEVSTTQFDGDSVYEDESISKNKDRKTTVNFSKNC